MELGTVIQQTKPRWAKVDINTATVSTINADALRIILIGKTIATNVNATLSIVPVMRDQIDSIDNSRAKENMKNDDIWKNRSIIPRIHQSPV